MTLVIPTVNALTNILGQVVEVTNTEKWLGRQVVVRYLGDNEEVYALFSPPFYTVLPFKPLHERKITLLDCYQLDIPTIKQVFSQNNAIEVTFEYFSEQLKGMAPNDPQASYHLARLYEEGLGLRKDEDENRHLLWYKVSANLGHPDAQFRVSSYCDVEEGDKFLKSAAERGHVKAQLALGNFFLDGEAVGLEQNIEAGEKWLLAAIEQGEKQAACDLGIFYYDSENYLKAREYFKISADAGDTLGQFEYARLLQQGLCEIVEDKGEIFSYFLAAARQGHAVAQYETGLSFFHGNGVARDYQLAEKWLRKAANLRNEDAKEFLESFKLNLTVLENNGMEEVEEGKDES